MSPPLTPRLTQVDGSWCHWPAEQGEVPGARGTAPSRTGGETEPHGPHSFGTVRVFLPRAVGEAHLPWSR